MNFLSLCPEQVNRGDNFLYMEKICQGQKRVRVLVAGFRIHNKLGNQY
jgi:hypothetical protein